MNSKVKRVYVDSSVVSGMFDQNDHPERVRPFWKSVFDGKIRVVMSNVLADEIAEAPPHVREFYRTIPESQIERVTTTDESNKLANRYIAEGIVGAANLNDCLHVALASIAGVDVLVSFNCTHIVTLNRIPQYNAINVLSGFSQIEIRTPDEVIQ